MDDAQIAPETRQDPADAPAMLAEDQALRHLGISLVEAGPDKTVTSLTVGRQHLNGLGVCHGGVLFSLADAAMAYLSNAMAAATIEPSVAFAANAEVDFLRPASLGTVLTAVGRTTATAGRTMVHDVEITDDNGQPIAVFRGRTRTVAAR